MSEAIKLALYREYVGDQRFASEQKLVAVAETEAAINEAFHDLYSPGYRWRLEDWETGETLDTFTR